MVKESTAHSQFSTYLADIRRHRDDVDQRLKEAANAFSSLKDPTPGDITDYWDERLEALASRVPGLSLNLPKCDRSHDQIQELQAQGRTLIVNLPELTLPVLGIMHPNLAGHWSVQPQNGIESVLHYGWLDVEDATASPHLGSNEENLIRIAKETGKYGMTQETYYIGAHDHFDRTGEYYDHGFKTAARLLGSRLGGRVLDANFEFGSRPSVRSNLDPRYRDASWGGRLEGVK